MKIKVINKNKNEKFKRFSISLPTALIKTKLFWKQVYKNEKTNKLTEETKIEYKKTIKTCKKIYKEIRKYVKEKGHFVLLEVLSNNYCVKIVL